MRQAFVLDARSGGLFLFGFDEVQRDVTHGRMVPRRVILAGPAVIIPERDIQRPVQPANKAPVSHGLAADAAARLMLQSPGQVVIGSVQAVPRALYLLT
jgi:hypothetical protein